MAVNAWRTGVPSIGHVVEVWHNNACILALWNGKAWQTVDGLPLLEVTHWRKR